MIIKSIHLINFRNHKDYFFEFQDNTSLIIGANGCGKTSILEAIYILTRGKSFRATDPEIIQYGADFYRIILEYQNGQTCTAVYDGKTKHFIILEKKSRRLPKKHKYPVILFLPSDLNLISHSPGRRRDYFDHIFSQFDENYHLSLAKYNKSLRQRNELLKDESITPELLFSWNILLAQYGTIVSRYRQNFIQEFNNVITKVYHSIAKNQDEVKIIYQSEAKTIDNEKYLEQLERNFQKDKYLGHTSFGIHRDDYLFEFNHHAVDGSASRGETRSIILALKFIEANLLYQKTNRNPIILLDDVFSELDEERRKCLVKNFQDNQVIITSVEDISKYQ